MLYCYIYDIVYFFHMFVLIDYYIVHVLIHLSNDIITCQFSKDSLMHLV